MQEQDKPRFKNVMIGLGEVYDKSIKPVIMDIYWQDFEGYSIEQFEKAVSDHRKDPDQGMFFPKTAHLIRQIEGTSKDKQNAKEAKAERIWSDLSKHLRLYGHRVPFDVEDGAALAALKTMGGMSQLNLIETKNMEWEGKKFIKLYLDNLEGGKTFEAGTLSLTPPQEQKRLESPEKSNEVNIPAEETKRMLDELLGRSEKPKCTPSFDDTERLRAEAIKRAQEWEKKRNSGKGDKTA